MILAVDATRAAGKRTGVGHHVMHLLHAWAPHELPFDEIRVLSPEPLEGFPDDPRFRLRIAPPLRNGTGFLWQATRLRTAASGADVFFGHYSLPPGYRGRAVVYNVGTYRGRWAVPGRRARLRAQHFRWSSRHSDVVIANSNSTKADVVRFHGIDPDRVVVIWPGAATDFRPWQAGDEEGTAAALEATLGKRDVPYFLFVGKLSKRRNVPALLEAFAEMRSRHPDFHLLVVGPAPDPEELERRIASLGLDGFARHVPFLDHAVLAPLYRGAHAFVLPTEHEGFSGTIPEALASGCPVVTVDHAALDDAGIRQAVYVVEDASPARLAAALDAVAADPELRERLARRGLEVARTLSWEETARQVMDVLERVARRS